MAGIFPIPIGRSSDSLVQQRLLAQLHSHELELLRLQDQLSTGRRISLPSQDAPAGLRAITLQRLLEQREQARTNLNTSQSYLSATDSSLSGVSALLIDLRGTALSVSDSGSTDQERQAAIDVIERAIERLVGVGNQKFRDRYLFAGSGASTGPFALEGGHVIYRGDENTFKSYADLGQLFDSSVSGNAVFGAISEAVRGSVDLNPSLTEQTRLADLRGGAGVQRGSIVVSDGTNSSTIDISGAETIGDVKELIEANPPAGRTLTVSITATGLTVQLDAAGGGSLTIKEANDGKTAKHLGIFEPNGVGTAPLVGQDVNPRLRLTTKLSDLPGLTDLSSGLQINNGGQSFVVSFAGAETVEDLLNAINGAGANVVAQINAAGTGIDVRSRQSGGDFQIGENGGTTASELGVRSFRPDTLLADLNFGSGVNAALGTDFTIRRNDGTDLAIDVSSAQTVGDVIDSINNHPANVGATVVARLAQFGNGIELVDTNAGPDTLTVTREPSSEAAWDLGLVPRGSDTAVGGGAPTTLTGNDVNPIETHGVFNSLIRLSAAIQNFDMAEIGRAIAMLDEDLVRVNFARAEVGSQLQSLDFLAQRLDTEEIELRDALSSEIDTDVAETVSNLAAQQATMQASLQMIARTFQISLLDYL